MAIAQRADVFAGRVQTKEGPVRGIWQRLKGKGGGPRLKLLVEAGSALTVQPKLGFADRARAVVLARSRAVFDQELGKAMAMAR